MKTVFINGSPKKHFSASGYFLELQSLFVANQTEFVQLRNRRNHKNILNQLIDADAAVFSVPLYVDGLPSHVLAFLQDMEIFCKEHKLSLKVYVISNNGFIEGKQNEPLFHVMKNFCDRSHNQWCGGIGIGGGVMFNALRVVFCVEMIIFLISVLISGFLYENWIPFEPIHNLLNMILLILFFHLGVLFYMYKMSQQINKKEPYTVKYTSILIPSFLFILIADIYFIIVSLLKGGLFKDWLKEK